MTGAMLSESHSAIGAEPATPLAPAAAVAMGARPMAPQRSAAIESWRRAARTPSGRSARAQRMNIAARHGGVRVGRRLDTAQNRESLHDLRERLQQEKREGQGEQGSR